MNYLFLVLLLMGVVSQAEYRRSHYRHRPQPPIIAHRR